MKVINATHSKIHEIDFENLAFGEIFTDHMFYVIISMVNGKILV